MHTNKMTTSGLIAAVAAAGVAMPVLAQSDASVYTNREYLADQYLMVMRSENLGMDIEDANYLQGAAVNALRGGPIAPRDWTVEPLVQATPQELEAARQKLQYAIDSGASQQMPAVFSRALVGYDCWVGQQSAQPNASHNLYDCREMYYANAAHLPDVPTTRTVTTQVPVALKELHKVYFEWDKHNLTQSAKNELDDARSMLLSATTGKLIIVGHADASGPRDYNRELSRKRAMSVVNYLGLTEDRYEIETAWVGEDRLQVPTADGVREPRNRVVVVGIRADKTVPVKKEVPVTY